MDSGSARLDVELVRRGLARSREHAQELIKGGRVRVAGAAARKPATPVGVGAKVEVEAPEGEEWASRGALKLLGALDAFDVPITGRRVLDAGASTGGFTDVCLRRGAESVVAVDVGHDQILPRLRADPRVKVIERKNVRKLALGDVGKPCDAMVGDLSFISLTLVLPAIAECLKDGAWLLPMVKPQFEVGRERLGSGGVVRSPLLRAEATAQVAESAQQLGLGVRGVVASPVPGPSGNVEYFLWLVKAGEPMGRDRLEALIDKAVKEGPQ